MNHVWWRMHLRQIPGLEFLGHMGDFNEADESLPFLTETLDLPAGGRVLELGCGTGAVSVRLAQWGYQVTAVEEAEWLLSLGRGAAREHHAEIEFRQADLRSLPERSVFDGALMLDFGAFSDADNAAMMRAVATALKPGGRVIFATCNPYYWARAPRTEHRLIERTDVVRRHRFDFDAGTVVSRVRCILADGTRRDLPAARYRAYTLPELRALAAATGLADLRIYGEDETGRPRSDVSLDSLRTPYLHCVALRPVTGEAGEGI
ncbi:MAG: class I SAM-dependent methyltransferase [Armatimonadota bacterium]